MKILEYNHSLQKTLTDMMVDYMAELACPIPQEVIRGKLSDAMDQMALSRLIRIRIAFAGDTPAGFSVFQIDRPGKDWCLRPGCGFVREFYVVPAWRKHGLGKDLETDTIKCLADMGAKGLYLTSTGAVPFWQKCGWKLSAEITETGQAILEKDF